MSLLQTAQTGTAPEQAGPEVEVAVLGPVEIRGAAQPFRRAAARELVVYLAFHRQGVRSDVWSSALWTDRPMAPSTLHSTASVARRALGQSKDGTDHLPRGGTRLGLAPTVQTDVERFARAAADPEPDRWRQALTLVRGRLFDGLRLADWAVLDGTQAQVETLVVDTALKGAAYHFGHGHGEEAAWMIRRGLLVSPYDERLYRALLWSAEIMGNRVGLHATMEELLSVAAEASPPVGHRRPGRGCDPSLSNLHPKTVALFRELAGRERPVAGGDPTRL